MRLSMKGPFEDQIVDLQKKVDAGDRQPPHAEIECDSASEKRGFAQRDLSALPRAEKIPVSRVAEQKLVRVINVHGAARLLR